MNHNNFKNIELKLYRYYENLRAIDELKKHNVYLSKKNDEIEKILKTNDFKYDVTFGSLTYEDKVQTSSSGESVIEKQIMWQAEKYLRCQEDIVYKILENDLSIRKKEIEIIKIGVVLTALDKEERKFVEMRYKDKLLIEDIAYKLNMSDRNIFYIKKRLMEKLEDYFKEEDENGKQQHREDN